MSSMIPQPHIFRNTLCTLGCLSNLSCGGRSVLELGAGSGITGVFALKRLPDISFYTFTDCHLKVLNNLRLNVTNNLLDSGEMMRDDTECLEMRTSVGPNT